MMFTQLMIFASVMVYFWGVIAAAFLLAHQLRRRRITAFEAAYERQHPSMFTYRASIMPVAETQEVPALQPYTAPRPRLRHINPSELVSLEITPDENQIANLPPAESNLQKLIHHLTKNKTTATVPTINTASAD